MGMKTSLHAFKGMNRDISRSKANNEYVFDAQNIRFTAREGETLLSVTNEKGNLDLGISFQGTVIGHCVINKYLVVFSTTGSSGAVRDYIYRVDVDNNDATVLYSGNLNFSKSNPIESLGIYENENIQKVYWVDGTNQPRVINITKDKLIGGTPDYNNNSFDFVQELELKESVAITRDLVGNGSFSPGVIQYAFTYYNKYGQESNIFYATELLPLAHNNRGGSPEDKVNNSFTINISGIDTQFDYIRIYSIHRTSIDATPSVRRVADVEIASTTGSFSFVNAQETFYKRYSGSVTVYEYVGATGKALSNYSTTTYPGQVANNNVPYYCFKKADYPNLILDLGTQGVVTFGNADVLYVSTEAVAGPGESTMPIIVSTSQKFVVASSYTTKNEGLMYTDNGATGNDVDPVQLLYIGGESLIASSITQKDQTLFLGNLKLNREAIPEDIKTSLYAGTSINSKVSTASRKALLDNDTKGGYYSYSSSFSARNSIHKFVNTAGFKAGEHYRLGIQFQHKSGKWSEPVLIGDYTVSDANRPNLSNDGELTIPGMKYKVDSSVRAALKEQAYKKMRAVVVFPSLQDRKIILQGMLCPTVFNLGNRASNTPFAQSSWFIRPNMPTTIPNASDNNTLIDNGAWVEFRHNHGIINGPNRGAEIQNITYPSNTTYSLDSVNYPSVYPDIFMVDQSILTMHSPDIEFDSVIKSIDCSNLQLRIVGAINFTSSIGDIDVQTSSPTINFKSTGFVHKTLGNYDLTGLHTNKNAHRGLVAGLFYKDWIVDDQSKDTFGAYTKQSSEVAYMVYPWQKTGSLNNDVNRPANQGARSAVLSKKKMSNLKFSAFNTWFSVGNYWRALGSDAAHNGITPVQVFDSNEVDLIKIPMPENADLKAINYYGNVDSLLPSRVEYNQYFTGDLSGSTSFYDTEFKTVSTIKNIADYTGNLKTTRDPVRMKYKSAPHLVFSLNYTGFSGSQLILPSIGGVNKVTSNIKPFWFGANTMFTPSDGDYTELAYAYTGTSMGSTPSTYGYEVGDLYWSGYNEGKLYSFDGTQWVHTPLNSSYAGKKYIYKTSSSAYLYEVKYLRGTLWGLELIETIADTSDTGFSVKQDTISETANYPYLFLAELYRDPSTISNPFGGTSDDALKENQWIPASNPVSLEEEAITFDYGDTWYQRYDCLKTYPFTQEDENQMVEIASFMCETRVNIDGRYDRNRGQISNLNMSPRNFNLLNPIYTQRNNFFNYRILDKDYYNLNTFPNTITWSKEKVLAEEVDTWANITMANTLDLDGSKGKVNALKTFNNEIYCFQDTGISNILFNSRVQIPASDGVPIEISNGYKVDGKRYLSGSIGCKNKWSIAESPRGLYFVDSDSSSIYVIGNGLTNLSAQYGFEQWAKENCSKDFFRTYYDKNYGDVYFTTDETSLCFSERLDTFTSFMSYGNTPAMFNVGNSFYAIAGIGGGPYSPRLWKQFGGVYNQFFGVTQPYSLTFICNQDEPYDKIFNNLEFRADTWDGETLTNETFDTLEVWNEYQRGKSSLTMSRNKPSTLQKKFRVWRANIPRDSKNYRDRIRNTWAFIKLSKNYPVTYRTELHDVMVHYFI